MAAELREKIIATVAQNGGHLASNLGTVELTLVLHRLFTSPTDKLVWDVGHQSYTHKLLTGRRVAFATLRQAGGLSGYPKRAESPHDCFGAGHSSTSISAALGLATARDLSGQRHHVVAVIGDGAMTGGMAFEALNHAGQSGTRLIVILNDNEMSISENVGALSSHLSRLRSNPAYFRIKADVEYLLRRIPLVGKRLAAAAERLKDSLKYLLVRGAMFEELGFTYLGPVDGHNLTSLQEVLGAAKKVNGPVLVHVLTRKGKGYPPAEKNPDRFHGVGPFDQSTGLSPRSEAPPSFTQVFGQTMLALAAKSPKLVAISAAMTAGTGLEEFRDRYPGRFFDVGIAEQHAVTFAAGLAAAGYKPVVAIYSTFFQRAYDQIIHDVCLQNLPVVLAIDRGGIVGEDGETHQGVFDLSFLRLVPNLTVLAPKDENELQQMLYTAVQVPGPVAIRYPRQAGFGVPLDQKCQEIPLGRAEELRSGRDAAILAIGTMVPLAQSAAELLAGEGIEAMVLNCRSVKPLDTAAVLRAAQSTGAIITVEDNILAGGFGSAVSEALAAGGSAGTKVRHLGLPDRFIAHGPRAQVLEQYGLTPAAIAAAVRDLTGRRAAATGRKEGQPHG